MTRDTSAPHLNAHFIVDLGDSDVHAPAAGFCEVVFPQFPVDAGETGRRLVLRRGVTGSLDLYAWWNEARRDKSSRPRTIKVQLMTPDLARAVMTWTFHGARPVTLSYTPLNALEAAILIESLEVAFDDVDIR
jgi:T4-like virus tail tube protein gp19